MENRVPLIFPLCLILIQYRDALLRPILLSPESMNSNRIMKSLLLLQLTRKSVYFLLNKLFQMHLHLFKQMTHNKEIKFPDHLFPRSTSLDSFYYYKNKI